MNRRLTLLLLASLLLPLASLWWGAPLEGPQADFIFYQLRLPRLLLGALAGSALALAGAAFQIIFTNPLATPSTVGTLAGATLGALAALVFGVQSELFGLPLTTLLSFAGALGTTFSVAAMASSGRARMNDVLLAGIAVSLAASAIATGLQYLADPRAAFAATRWSLGQLPQVGYRGVWLLAPFVAFSTVLLLSQTRALTAFVLGEDLAHAQGVAVRRLRLVVLMGGSLSVAAIVSWCGPIAFVGLIVPHLVRLAVGPSVRRLLWLSAVVGAAFLTLCDAFARAVVPGRDLPVGVVTAALGAPALILLIVRRR